MTQTPILLALDEGTTNAKAVCLTRDGQMLAKGSHALQVTHPQPAWSEQEAGAILEGIQSAIQQALDAAGPCDIAGIGVSNQRESILLWERATGTPLSPVVIWQCRRSLEICKRLVADGHTEVLQRKTGLPVDPLFPAAKIQWLLHQIPEAHSRAQNGELCCGTIDTWLVWNLTGGQQFVTDVSNASRTQLFNLQEQDWDEELLALFDIPRACLPAIQPSSALRGETRGFSGLPDGIPILSQVGDSHASLYGQGGFLPGMIKASYGTGSSLMTPVAQVSGEDYRLARTVAWDDGQLTYALEGNITHTGAAVGFMARILGKDVEELAQLAAEQEGNDGAYFVPALSGLGAPHWKAEATGLITGLTDHVTPATLARAALESMAYQVADVYYLMEELSGTSLDAVLVDGGATHNAWLMQFQANLLQRPLIRNETAEVSAIGAGYLAGKALGWWPSRDDLAHLQRRTQTIEPNLPPGALDAHYEGWKKAVSRTLFDA